METRLTVRRLAGDCEEEGICPTVYVSDRSTLVLQGPDATGADGVVLGPGELAVELSVDLLKDALRAYDNR